MSDALDVLDAQVHLTLDFDEPRILAAMDALGIRRAILDEFWYISEQLQGMPCVPLPGGSSRPVSPYAEAASLRHPERFAYLQRVTPEDPALSSVMALLASSPACRAGRLILFGAEQRAAFGAGGYDAALGHAQAHGLPMCVLGVDVSTLPAVTTRFPELTIVLDHCGWARNPQHWEDILQTASLPTVFLKWCHAHRAFGQVDDPDDAIQREFLRALQAFGAERVMWASDITQEQSDASWSDLLAFVRDNPALSPADKQRVLAGTARSVFRWDAAPIAV